MGARRTVVAVGAAIACVTAGVVTPFDVQGARTDVLLDGLNSQKGLAMGPEGNLVVAQGAFGPPDPVLVYVLRGRDRGAMSEVSEPATFTNVAISPLDGTAWALAGPFLVHQLADGSVTAIQDIALGVGPHLYVYEVAADGVLAFEEGFATGEFPPAVLLEARGRNRKELAPGELSEPGGIVVDGQRVYVTDGVFTGGRLLNVR